VITDQPKGQPALISKAEEEGKGKDMKYLKGSQHNLFHGYNLKIKK